MPLRMHNESPATLTLRALLIATALLFGTCSDAHGQPSTPPISSSRLGLTKAPGVVAASAVQVEAGYAYADLDDRTRHTVGETLLRVGVGGQTELRAGLPSYVHTTTSAGTVSGIGDGLIAVRRRFTTPSGIRPMLALQAGATIPVGAEGVTAGEVQPEVGAYALWRLADGFQLLTMGVHRHAVASGNRYGQTTFAGGLRREFGGNLGMQLDYGIGHSTRSGARDAHQVRAAAAVRLSRDLQLDTYVGRSTAGGGSETLLGVGVSVRR